MSKKGSEPPSSGDYEVGYRKPPKHSQFRKGQSGNPAGRPKTAKAPDISAQAMLVEKLRTPRRALEGGVEVTRQRIDILIDQQLNAFATGKIKSLKPLFELLERFDKHAMETVGSDGVDYQALVRGKLQNIRERYLERKREDLERRAQGLPLLYEAEDTEEGLKRMSTAQILAIM